MSLIVVISGPGGVGKGTIVRELCERDPELVVSKSWTTRKPRTDDREDSYFFVDDETFLKHKEEEGFIEWNEFLGSMYGTPMPDAIRKKRFNTGNRRFGRTSDNQQTPRSSSFICRC